MSEAAAAAAAASSPPAAAAAASRYRLVAQGATSAVYFDEKTGAAMKRLTPPIIDRTEAEVAMLGLGEPEVEYDRKFQAGQWVLALVREAYAMRTLSSVGAMPLLTCQRVTTSKGKATVVLVMPAFPMTLDACICGDRVKKQPPLSLQVVVGFLGQLAASVAHAHARGFVHRDIKPANILVDGNRRLVLGDWGMSRRVGGTCAAPVMSDWVVTPWYRAPEVNYGAHGFPVDVWSMGCVLYEMLRGGLSLEECDREAKMRFSTEKAVDHAQVLSRVAAEWAATLQREEGDGSLGARLAGAAASMLNLDPAARPSAAEVANIWSPGAAGIAEAGALAPPDPDPLPGPYTTITMLMEAVIRVAVSTPTTTDPHATILQLMTDSGMSAAAFSEAAILHLCDVFQRG